jgi:signal peptide peptidase SppA
MIEHAALVANVMGTPWALEPTQLSMLMRIVGRVAMGQAPPPSALNESATIRAARNARRVENQQIAGNVGIISVFGIILQRALLADDTSGLTSTQQISAQLRSAVADTSVNSIVLEFDSPGGSVFGIEELATEIHYANSQKPVIGIANSLAASAAYWLASQCAELFCTPSGSVGSIGVYCAHDDVSRAMDAAGVTTTLVAAGKHKTEGNIFEPLLPEARAYMQKTIDDYYATFVSQVARGRNVPVGAVRGGMGQGRTLSANDAKAAGMIDGVQTFGQVLARARTTRPGARAGTFALADDTSPAELRAMRASRAARERDLDLLSL